MDQVQNNLASRSQDRLGCLFTPGMVAQARALVLTASADAGVQRNGGRRGAAWGPQALLAPLRTMAASKSLKHPIALVEVADAHLESRDFAQGQAFESKKIQESLAAFVSHASPGAPIAHWGGGHDHIFPLLTGLEAAVPYQRLLVLNVDAHLDTRVDPVMHSGTPFRQFAEATQRPLDLWQWGIHTYANPDANWKPFSNKLSSMRTVPRSRSTSHEAEKLLASEAVPPGTLILLSLDADALDAAHMEAVSAVNHDGVDIALVKTLLHWAQLQNARNGYPTIFGIYEFNPIFDSLSQKSARTLASLLHPFLIGESL